MKFKAYLDTTAVDFTSNELFEVIKTQEDYDKAKELMERFVDEDLDQIVVEFDTEAGTAKLVEVQE